MSTAFIFPGQGSQYPGMGKELADAFPAARQIFEEADDALGLKLSAICFGGSEEELKLTANTQPAILTTSIAVLKVVEQETGLKAACLAGHSLGEYSALVCSGALAFADAVRTVRARGTFMQEAVPVGTGTMAAMLSIEQDVLEDICREAAQGEVVSPPTSILRDRLSLPAIPVRSIGPLKSPRHAASGRPCCCRSAPPSTAP